MTRQLVARVEWKCANCSVTRMLIPSEAKQHKYCSRDCFWDVRHSRGAIPAGETTAVCGYCEKTFEFDTTKRYVNKYCSSECRKIVRQNSTTRTCAREGCGATFQTYYYSKRRYCSRQCTVEYGAGQITVASLNAVWLDTTKRPTKRLVRIQILEQQGMKCAICDDRISDAGLAFLDHDHRDGRVRGVLCSTCNLGIGQLKDDPHVLRKAALYLESHQVISS